MKPLKNNDGYFIIPVPGDATELHIARCRCRCVSIGWLNPNMELETKKLDVEYAKYEFIGTFTPNHIDFDVEGFLQANGKVGKDPLYKTSGLTATTDKIAAFHSLIQASGYYYSNPYGDEPKTHHYDFVQGVCIDYTKDYFNWQIAEQNVLQKGVIIKKI